METLTRSKKKRQKSVSTRKLRIDCDRGVFSDDELFLLEKYGNKLQMLAEDKVRPKTKAQKRFIDVAKGKKEPFSTAEWAWNKYTRRREIEKDMKEKMEDFQEYFNLMYT